MSKPDYENRFTKVYVYDVIRKIYEDILFIFLSNIFICDSEIYYLRKHLEHYSLSVIITLNMNWNVICRD